MSATPTPRQTIDIEEFERRLRAPEPKPAVDPLAELARLVGGQNKTDPLAALFAEPGRPETARGYDGGERAPAPQPPAYDDYDRAYDDDRPALRGALDREARDLDDFDERSEDWSAAPADVSAVPPPPPRSKKPLYLTAAVIAAGFIGIGGSLAWRGSSAPVNGVTPTIQAASGPAKVAPPATQGAEEPGRDSALLDKSAATPPVKQLVSREEAPMDPAQAGRVARVVSMNGAMPPMQPGAQTGAQTVVGPMQPMAGAAPNMATGMNPAGQTPVAPVVAPPQRPSGMAAFPEPVKKVKTVAVRPDGSIISSETTASAPLPPTKTATPPAAKNATPKSPARVAATPRSGDDEADTPRAAPKAKPEPRGDQAKAEPDAEPRATNGGGGGYAVQLSAAGSEAEARQTATRLGQKYSDALGGRRPSFHKAADKDVYRVRVTGLSREGATSACEKVKAAGGGCFVAKN